MTRFPRAWRVLLLCLLAVWPGWGPAGAQPAYPQIVVSSGVTVAVPSGLRQAPGLGAWPDTPLQVEGLASFTDDAAQPLTIAVRKGEAPDWETLPAAGSAVAAEWAQSFADALQMPEAYDVTPGRYDPERGRLSLSYKVVGPSPASLMRRLPERHPLWAATLEAGEDPKLTKCVLRALLADQPSASEFELRARVPFAAIDCGLPDSLIDEYLKQLGPSEFAPSRTTVTYLAFFSRTGTIGTLIMAPVDRQQAVDEAAELVWSETEVAAQARFPVAPAVDAFRLAQLAGLTLGAILGVLCLGGGLSWLLVRLGVRARLAVGSTLGLACALALVGVLRAGALQLEGAVLLGSYLLSSALAFQPLVRWLSGTDGSLLGRSRSSRRSRGLSTVEMTVLLVLVVSVGIGAWRLFGDRVQRALSNSGDRLDQLGQLATDNGPNPLEGLQSATYPGPTSNSAPGGASPASRATSGAGSPSRATGAAPSRSAAGAGAGSAAGRAPASAGAARPSMQSSANAQPRSETRGSALQGAAASVIQALQPGRAIASGPPAPLPANAGKVIASPAKEPSLLLRGADIATDFVPYVSNVKDATIAITGVNPVTGEKVGTFGRVVAGVFALPAAGNVLKYASKGTKYVLTGGKAAYEAVQTARAATKVAEAAGKVAEREVAQALEKQAERQIARQAEERTAKEATAAGAAAASRRLKTEANEAVFWSGIPGQDKQAAAWVQQHGGTTLENQLQKHGIELPPFDRTKPETVAAWRKASKEFAEGASGNVRVLQEDAVGVQSVWGEVEHRALLENPNVTSITAIDPRTGLETLLWKR